MKNDYGIQIHFNGFSAQQVVDIHIFQLADTYVPIHKLIDSRKNIYENSTYDVQNELKAKYPEMDMVVLIASVRNTNRMNSIFDSHILRIAVLVVSLDNHFADTFAGSHNIGGIYRLIRGPDISQMMIFQLCLQACAREKNSMRRC